MTNDFNKYTSLSIGAQQALCFYAYAGLNYYGNSYDRSNYLSSFALKQGFTPKEVHKELEKAGIMERLQSPWARGSHYFAMKQGEYIGALLFLYKEHPKWAKDYTDYRFGTSTDFTNIRKSVKEFAQGKSITPVSFTWNQHLVSSLFEAYVSDINMVPLLNALNDNTISSAINEALINSFMNDTPFDFAGLSNVIKSLKQLPPSRREDAECSIALYQYLYDGTYEPSFPASHKHYISYLLKAIRLMNMGEYTQALSIFAESLKMRNKNNNQKNIYTNPISNYYLLLAYHLDSTPQSRTKLLQFHKKKNILSSHGIESSPALAYALLQDGEDDSTNQIRYLLTHGELCSNERNLLKLFASYWGLDNHKYKPNKPQYKILRHEMSYFLNLTDEEKEELEKLYGNKPVLTSIRRKQAWETVLENVANLLGAETRKTSSNEGEKHRLAYIISGESDWVEIREQHILKNGEWSVGKKVGLSTFLDGNIDCMCDEDIKIRDAHNRSYDYHLHTYHVIPHLIGSDRVYTGYNSPFTPVDIQGELAYLEFRKGANGYEVVSNINEEELRDLEDCCIIRKLSRSSYMVITVNQKCIPYYKQMIKLKRIPIEAEPRLKSILPQLGKVMEVHSDLLEGGSSVEIIEGQSAISVMVKNVSADLFDIQLRVRPTKNSNKLVVPGIGSAMVLDEIEGKRVRIKRNIKEEATNYNVVADFIESELEADITKSDTDNILLNTQEVLSLMDFVASNKDISLIEWENGAGLKLKKAVNPASWNVNMRAEGGWFEIEGDIRLDDDTILSMGQLLQLLSSFNKDKYIRLNDEEFILLSSSLRKQLAQLEAVASSSHGKTRISALNASLLSDDVFDGGFSIKKDNKLEELRQKIKESRTARVTVPRSLNATLRDYQTEGFQWMSRMDSWGAGVCLADDMGLGKTVQTIAFLLRKAKHGASLVVAPVSVIPNWRKELERFAPTLSVRVINNTDDRSETIKKAKANDIVLSSYGMLLTNSENLCNKKWNAIVLDEAHAIKNRDTKTSATIMKLECASRIILTGTPIQNNLGELWNLFQFANPGMLGSWDEFNKKFITPIENDKDKERQKQLKKIIQPFMLRRTKNDVLDDLPEKNEITLPVELSDEELSVYELIRRKAEKMLQEGGEKFEIQTLTEITRLRQAACSISLVEKHWEGANSKVETFINIAENISNGGNRALVFSQFTSFLAIIRERLDELRIPYLYLDGSTPVKQRERLVNEFQNGDSPLFLISLKAGGLGLNLVGANYVVHLDPWWNPAIEQQATDRAHRIGQQQNVTVYRLITKNTIEEKILRLHQTKKNLADALLEGTDMSHKITPAELLEMLSQS